MDTLDWNTSDEPEPRDTYYHTGCGGLVIAGYCTLCEMDEDEARAVLGGADPHDVALPADELAGDTPEMLARRRAWARKSIGW